MRVPAWSKSANEVAKWRASVWDVNRKEPVWTIKNKILGVGGGNVGQRQLRAPPYAGNVAKMPNVPTILTH